MRQRINASLLLDRVILVLALAMAAYHLVATQYLLQDPFRHINTHLMFALALVYLAGLKGKRWPLTLALLLLGLATTGYVYIFTPELQQRVGFPTTADLIVGGILVLVILEAARRAVGVVFTIIGLMAIAYALVGYYLPRPFHTTEIELSRLIAELCTNLTGLYGTALMVSVNYIFLFVLLGGLIGVSSASRFFYQFGLLAGQRMRSGAAMTAVVGSTLVGMITGVPGANVAITGNFTIPLMKQAGYKPEQAGAIEAAASTGGQFMPPVMGAAAFIMAGLTGIPYIQICIAAFLPALLYAVANGLYCHFQALKLNIAPLGLKADKRELLSTSPSFIVPFAVIIVLFLKGFSPMYVAFWAVVATSILTLIIKPRPSVTKLLGGFSRGATMGAAIGIACASIGIVIRVVAMTGLGVRLGSIVGDLSGGIPIIALILTALAALVLGCGVPTTPAYILVGMIAAPVLVNMGYSMMQAHLFVLYFACMSMVTVPVAPAALVASKLAGTSFMKTAVECVKPAAVGWIVPFIFMWVPLLILQPGEVTWFQLLAIVGFMTTLVSLEAGFVNHYFLPCTAMERAIALIALPMLFLGIFLESSVILFAVIALFAILTMSQLRRRKRSKSPATETPAG